MKSATRIVIGLVGLFNAAIGLSFLFDPIGMASEFALSPIGTQGMATMRADFPALFLTGAMFALVGAWRAEAKPLLVTITLLAFVLFGRTVSILLDGTAPTTAPPMIIEAIMIVLLTIGHRVFSRSDG